MEYLKLSCSIDPVNDLNREIVTGELSFVGFESFIDTETGIDAFIPSNQFNNQSIEELPEQFKSLFTLSFSQEIMPDENWNEQWEKNYFEPLIIGDCLIRAPFHTEYPHCKYEIVIEPKMAFGTGNHETTSLMIDQILHSNVKNKSVLDMGCGTGILGILCSMCGAKRITSIDIDEWSYNSTLENASYNKISNIEAFTGDASLLGEKTFDLILANIHKNVLINDMARYVSVMNPNATLIMSGFYTADMTDIRLKAESLGLKEDGYTSKNDWVAYRFKK
ncbi:MAG: 50S ribosomal protein L11 methyltransferase [Bacteroidota bacterium]|nr:50S ribosomal protein L11 methyltransferase [Bacteroidota bacterium]